MNLLMAIGLFLGLFTPMTASETNASDPEQLNTYQANVTGGAGEENVKLSGTFLAPDSGYYKEIWAQVSGHDGEEWEIPYEGGYAPEMQFFDLTHNGTNDLFYQSATGNGQLHHHHLHTLKNGQLEEIDLPEQNAVQAKFQDDFKVAVQIDYQEEPSIIDVSDKAADYVKKGLYKENGEARANTSPLVAPIAQFEPIQVNDREGYGLKSSQQISGASRADKLGAVKTLWYYENGRWIILKTEWQPSE